MQWHSLLNFAAALTLPILCEAVNSWNMLHICSVISFTGLRVDFYGSYELTWKSTTVSCLEVNDSNVV